MGEERTLLQAIMYAGGMTGLAAKQVEKAVIEWHAKDENSLAFRCLEFIKANAQLTKLLVEQGDRVTELEDVLVQIAVAAQAMPDGERIITLVQGAAAVKQTEDNHDS